MLKENPSGNFSLGGLWSVLLWMISCIGRKLLFKVMENVDVLLLLSLMPAIGTLLSTFSFTFKVNVYGRWNLMLFNVNDNLM